MSRNWDLLIVLDACCYNIFKSVYDYILINTEIFQGKLLRAISPGSETVEWLHKTFNNASSEFRDCVYISANPYINSKIPVHGFDAKKVFYKVIDVWDFGWDYELGTVPPSWTTLAAQLAVKLYHDKRLIIHYLQPHEPYILLARLGIKPIPSFSKMNTLQDQLRILQIISRLMTYLRRRRLISKDIYYRFRWYLKLGLGNIHIDLALGRRILLLAYLHNLLLALLSVKELLKKMRDVYVIMTADHGELLGEYGMYGHRAGLHVRELIEVPWLEIVL